MTRSLPSPKLLVTGGAILVASIAYAIGTQTSDGTAGAAIKSSPSARLSAAGTTGTTSPSGRRGHGPGRGFGPVLADAASALGVSPAELRAALEELRPTREPKGERRDDLAAALAKSLGVDAAKVTAALDAQRPARGERPERTARFAALAKELGLTAAKVEAALKAVRPERRAQDGTTDGRDAFLAALAKELGVTKEKLATALGTVGGPGGPGHGPGGRGHGPGGVDHDGPGGAGRGGPGLDAAALATALGVEQAKVTDALTAFRAAERKEHEARRATFVKQLAEKLGVSEAKVFEVLGRFGRGPGRDHGPGRP